MLCIDSFIGSLQNGRIGLQLVGLGQRFDVLDFLVYFHSYLLYSFRRSLIPGKITLTAARNKTVVLTIQSK